MDKKPTPKSKVDISPRGVASVSGSVDGGIIFGDNSKVSVGGDMVGRDKIVTTTTSTGITAEDVTKIFDSIYAKISQKPAEQQASIRGAVDIIKAEAQKEAVKGEKPNELMVEMSSQALATSAPDLLTDMADVALATLANPASGVVTIIRKIAQKIKASRGSA